MEIYAVRILNISEETIDKLCLFIDKDKKCRIKKYINKQDKIRTLIGDILIRFIVMKKFEIKNKNTTFTQNDYGKPLLKDYSTFNFNISHSDDFVVCAIDNKPIGIDIEKIKQIEYEEIAKNFFSVSEVNYIINKDFDHKLNRFYEIWTLKESFIKCCGQGLKIPLKSFSIGIDKYENIKVTIDNEPKKYSFKRFTINDCYKMSICSGKKEISNNIVMIDQNDLINNFRFCIGLGED